MLDSRPCGARMTRLSLGLDSRLCGNDEGWLLIPACAAAGMTEWEVAAAVAFWLPDVSRAAQKIRHRIADCRLPIADCRLPIADCRLPIADCRLPIADCRLPIADCRLPIADGNGVCGQRRSSYSGWFVSCLFLCVMPMASATDKSHYT